MSEDLQSKVDKGLIREIQQSSPEQKVAFKMEFIFALVSGLLSSITPIDGTNIVEDSDRASIRERTRNALRHYKQDNPNASALDLVRKGHAYSADEYKLVARTDHRFVPECELAINVQKWTVSLSEIDDNFAQRVIEYIEL